MLELLNMKVVIILTFGFTLAAFLGYLSMKLKLSPIMGYLAAGYLIGPHSPGFVADRAISEQLAEIGVILMMFGVGLHFKWQDLVRVKDIAVPGAIGQTLLATTICSLIMRSAGWSWEASIVFGLAIGVASTVVLVKVLTTNNLIKTQEGRISVGWLVVEDIITVAALLLIPTLAASFSGQKYSPPEVLGAFTFVIIKFFLLALIMFTVGKKAATFILAKIYKMKSEELFLLSVLALTFGIATGSCALFGTSIALGSFLAGMSISQTPFRHRVLIAATPLKDTFIVIFFLSAGMMFNPMVIFTRFGLFLIILGVILIIKPLLAFIITILLKYPPRIGWVAGIALAQIGEFSFVMAEQSMKYNIMPEEGFDLLVACALVSLSINPSIFKLAIAKKSRSVTETS